MKTQILDYDNCGKPLRGFLVWDEAFSGIRPGVLVFHENMGLADHERLDMASAQTVSAPIRYGRRSGKNRGYSYTMVFSRLANPGHAKVLDDK